MILGKFTAIGGLVAQHETHSMISNVCVFKVSRQSCHTFMRPKSECIWSCRMIEAHAGDMQSSYGFVVCGSGSACSVVAGRLIESGRVSIPLLEDGGNDDHLAVQGPGRWRENIGIQRDWDFRAGPNLQLDDRCLSLTISKPIGGSSTIGITLPPRPKIRGGITIPCSTSTDPSKIGMACATH
jgi:hypothetical protein